MKFVERQQYVRRIEDKMRDFPTSAAVCRWRTSCRTSSLPRGGQRARAGGVCGKSKAIEERAKNEQSGRAADFLRMAESAGEFNAAGDERFGASPHKWRSWPTTTMARCRLNSTKSAVANSRGSRGRVGTSIAIRHSRSPITGGQPPRDGMVPLFMATQEELLHSLITSFLLAFVTIGAAMAWVMRNALAGLVAMLPNVLPIGFVFGVISWQGFRVDVGTVVTASIALGIAVDGTLHLINWFLIGLRNGLDRRDAVRNAVSQCGPAMMQTSLVVAFNLLMLYPAELVLVSRFGWLMAALIVAALVADLVLTPALLAGPLGALLEAGKKRDTIRPGMPNASEDSSNGESQSESREMVAAGEPAVEDHVYVVQPPKHHMDVAGGSIILRADPPGR